jgi:putative aldouronate transport system permease protein
MRYKKIVQTLTTIPNFISWVLVYSFAFTLFSVDAGLVNRLLIDWGVIDKGINFLLESDHIWFKMTSIYGRDSKHGQAEKMKLWGQQ